MALALYGLPTILAWTVSLVRRGAQPLSSLAAVARDRTLLARLGACIALWYLSAHIPLGLVQKGMRDAAVWALAACSISVGKATCPDGPTLTVEGREYVVAHDCTYVALVALLGPLLWKHGAPIAVNAGRLLVAAAIIGAVNIGRLAVTCALDSPGWWSWAWYSGAAQDSDGMRAWTWVWTEHVPNCLLFVAPVLIACAARFSETCTRPARPR